MGCMMTENVIYMAALLVIALSCLLGVFTQQFDDNLLQRMGLAMACIGATAGFVETFIAGLMVDNIRCLVTYGVAVMCVATVWKFWRKT